LLYDPGAQKKLGIKRDRFDKFDVHGSCPAGRQVRVLAHVEALISAFDRESRPRGVAIYQGAGYASIEKAWVRAMVGLPAPPADAFISFEKALYT
jgi:hypothetical protein